MAKPKLMDRQTKNQSPPPAEASAPEATAGPRERPYRWVEFRIDLPIAILEPGDNAVTHLAGVNLKQPEKRTLALLQRGLDRSNTRLGADALCPDGRPISSSSLAVRWLLQHIAAAIEASEPGR